MRLRETRTYVVLGVALLCVSACKESAPSAASQIRPVRTVKVERRVVSEPMILTGQIRAQEEINLAFPFDGRLIERFVTVGDQVTSGQVVARLDPQNEQNTLRAAEADNSAAQSGLTQAQKDEQRLKDALAKGGAQRPEYDQAYQRLQQAKAQATSAEARLRGAQDRVKFTELRSDAVGTVTMKGAEPGEIVRAGQPIVQIAREGWKDAVFGVPAQLLRLRDVPRDVTIEVSLVDNPNIRARGRIREIAPQADPITRTYPVKVALLDPPDQMLLGSTVTGTIAIASPPVMELPAMALTETSGKPAVWVVDPVEETVALRSVEVSRYDPTSVIIARGLRDGEVVVSAGVHLLRPGQKVKPLGGSS